MARLAGKVVVITGTTLPGGLGEGLALAAAKEGAKALVLCGRNVQNGEIVKSKILEACPNVAVHLVAADLLKEEDCRAIVKAAVENFGRLDGLINAAGAASRGCWGPENEAIWQFKKQGDGGSIVNISSISGYGGQPFLAGYSATKAALNALTKNAAYANKEAKIRVNALALGWMATAGEELTQKAAHNAGDDWVAEADKKMPFGRILRPSDVSPMAVHLLSDDSALQTGGIIDLGIQTVVIGASD